MFVGIVLVFVLANQDFFEFEREYTAKGYEWKYVGRTPAEPGYPHLEVYEDEKPYYYYQLVKPQEENSNP